jgi:hypothetical protein
VQPLKCGIRLPWVAEHHVAPVTGLSRLGQELSATCWFGIGTTLGIVLGCSARLQPCAMDMMPWRLPADDPHSGTGPDDYCRWGRLVFRAFPKGGAISAHILLLFPLLVLLAVVQP